MAHRNAGAAPKTTRAKKASKKPATRATGPNMDSLGFQAMDSNVPGLSHVILQKLNMKSYDDYKSAMDGRKKGRDFGIRTYFDMFQKMEDTFKFCVECKKLPDALPDPKSLRRCKRCQNVYYCSLACQRTNWPLHKKFCKKLKLVALDRLVEWLVFTGDIPFPTETWTKPVQDVKGWEDWFAMQEQLEEKLAAIVGGRYMTLLWANAGKPRPEEGELCESIKRLVTDFHSRPVTIGLGLRLFGIEPLARPLTVHVVGASHVETLNTRATDYDELTRMFPGHQGMEVVMVGVDVVDGPIMRPPLAALGPRGRVYLSSYKGLYHDFWEGLVETQQAARPDLVVGFHPGFHACPDLMEGWLPTLLLLRDYCLPTLFTVYSEQELKASLQILLELEMRITGYGVNPFASLRPEQVYSSPNKAPVYCSSYYIACLGPVGPDGPHVEELEEDDED
ncbi:Y7331 protein, partial [Crypturellus undulatus]|nr:Y7331 protein [Crypturellus undulatus]